MKGKPAHNSASADSSSGNDGPLSKTQSMSFGSHLSVTKLPLIITRCTSTRFSQINEPAQRFRLDATQLRFQPKACSDLFQGGRMDARRKLTIVVEIRDHARFFALAPVVMEYTTAVWVPRWSFARRSASTRLRFLRKTSRTVRSP